MFKFVNIYGNKGCPQHVSLCTRWMNGTEKCASALCDGGMRYTVRIMFIHRTFNAGCGDRGAWPWRKPAQLNC